MKRIIGFFIVLILGWACSSDSDTEGTVVVDPINEVSFERSAMLINWADNIIIPSYEAFSTDLDLLIDSFDAFKENPNEDNLVKFRSSWISAYSSWQHVAMFEIGPAETVGFQLICRFLQIEALKVFRH